MKIDRLINVLLESGAHRAVFYEYPKRVIRATRVAYDGKFDKREHNIALAFCRPNYREVAFIKKLKQAGEPFPVKKPQLQFLKAA